MGEPTNVRVLAFGGSAELLGWQSRELRLAPGATLADLIAELLRAHPQAAAASTRWRLALNQRYADAADALRDGDEVAIIPPVAGG